MNREDSIDRAGPQINRVASHNLHLDIQAVDQLAPLKMRDAWKMRGSPSDTKQDVSLL